MGVKILTWNVDGIRSLYKDDASIREGLESLDADIICFQETKISRNQLDKKFAVIDGYSSYFGFPRSETGHSGAVTYCKESVTPFCAEGGLSGLVTVDADDIIGSYGNIRTEFSKRELKELALEGQAVITLHKIQMKEKMLAVINVCCPSDDTDKKKGLQRKERFYQLLQIRATTLKEKGYFVIVVGDLNIGHKPIDYYDPSQEEDFESNPCRRWLDRIIFDLDPKDISNGYCETTFLIDAFRFIHPTEENVYTYWSSNLDARANNFGSRLDYLLVDKRLFAEIDDCIIMSTVQGSDHCPVKLIINIEVIPAPNCPSFSKRYYPEFSGTRRKVVKDETDDVPKRQNESSMDESLTEKKRKIGIEGYVIKLTNSRGDMSGESSLSERSLQESSSQSSGEISTPNTEHQGKYFS
ncbi:hypothetical protein L9F63_020312, partial [Diploptera punctata]